MEPRLNWENTVQQRAVLSLSIVAVSCHTVRPNIMPYEIPSLDLCQNNYSFLSQELAEKICLRTF